MISDAERELVTLIQSLGVGLMLGSMSQSLATVVWGVGLALFVVGFGIKRRYA